MLAALLMAYVALFRPAVIERVVEEGVGAVVGPDRYSPCESTNGITRCFTRRSLATATTTVCAIQSPAFASSTLVAGGVKFNTSSTTATIVEIARSATAFATTTSITRAALAANATPFVVASTSAVTELESPAWVFDPGQWLVVSMQGGAGTFSPTGFCQATFEVIN